MTGYQLHVRTFTLHTVLKTVADSYKPPNPPSVDVRPTKQSTSSGAKATSAAAASHILPIANTAGGMDVDVEDSTATALASTSATGAAAKAVQVVAVARQAPAVPSSLVKPHFDACIPEIVELLMEDLFGESAAAKEVSAC